MRYQRFAATAAALAAASGAAAQPCQPQWSALTGGGLNSAVRAVAVFNEGTGPALFAAGTFTTAGGLSANRIARRNGQGWSPLGAGTNSSVVALAVFDDGTPPGPALYAGGTFDSAGGAPASSIARWNGQAWSALGQGTVGAVRAL